MWQGGKAGARMAAIAAAFALAGAPDGAGAGEQGLKKVSKASGSCSMVRLPDGIALRARPYAMDRGALYFGANVVSIAVRKNGMWITPTSKEATVESLSGAFQGKIAARGLRAIFPLDALGPDSEVRVLYTGAGFVGDKKDDGEVWFKFDPKSYR